MERGQLAEDGEKEKVGEEGELKVTIGTVLQPEMVRLKVVVRWGT